MEIALLSRHTVDLTRHLTWNKLAANDYWTIHYEGQHVADIFKGKSGKWYGILFGIDSYFSSKACQDVTRHMAALILNPNN